jgi:hypothetical protein
MTALKRIRWRRRLGIVVVVLAVAIPTILNTFGWAGHVAWWELGQFNIGKFERQLRESLPLGMPKSAAEAYLEREKIPFAYEDGSPPYLWIFKKDVHRALFLIPGDLSVHVELDHDQNISQIRFRLQYK